MRVWTSVGVVVGLALAAACGSVSEDGILTGSGGSAGDGASGASGVGGGSGGAAGTGGSGAIAGAGGTGGVGAFGGIGGGGVGGDGGVGGMGGMGAVAGVGGVGGVPPADAAGGIGGMGAIGGQPDGGCDPMQCMGSGTAPACCTDAGNCGRSISFVGPKCIERDQPGTPDSSCPNLQLGLIQAAGCCRPDKICGYQDQLFGLGCVHPSDIGQSSTTPCTP